MAPKTRSQRASAEGTPDPKTGTSSAVDTEAYANSNNQVLRQRPREGSRSRNIEDVYDAKYAVDLAVDENVFLFLPNLIGYTRVILAGFALYYMPFHPKACTLLYGVSCLLDAVDGQAARALDQSSKFGAVLDMVTDRCTTACLLCYLASAYPNLALLFQFLISLDFASHYIHMYSSLVTGSSSHKTIGADVSRILYYYYNDKLTLFIFCFCNELFFVCLYLNAFVKTPIYDGFAVYDAVRALPLAHTFPKVFNCAAELSRAITWPQLIGLLNFPICFGKQIINIVQFWKAGKILVGIDLIERQQQREAKLKEERAAARR